MLLDDNALNQIWTSSWIWRRAFFYTNRWKQCRGYINHFWSNSGFLMDLACLIIIIRVCLSFYLNFTCCSQLWLYLCFLLCHLELVFDLQSYFNRFPDYFQLYLYFLLLARHFRCQIIAKFSQKVIGLHFFIKLHLEITLTVSSSQIQLWNIKHRTLPMIR